MNITSCGIMSLISIQVRLYDPATWWLFLYTCMTFFFGIVFFIFYNIFLNNLAIIYLIWWMVKKTKYINKLIIHLQCTTFFCKEVYKTKKSILIILLSTVRVFKAAKPSNTYWKGVTISNMTTNNDPNDDQQVLFLDLKKNK